MDEHGQAGIEDAILLQVLPRMAASAGEVLLRALREFVAEVARQELVGLLAKSGELLRTMVAFQVSKQLADKGKWDEWREYLVEESEDDIREKAHDAGYAGGESALDSWFDNNSIPDHDDIYEIARECFDGQVDLDDLAEQAAEKVDTKPIQQAVLDELLEMIQTQVKEEVASGIDQKQAQRDVLDRLLRSDDRARSRDD